ncbi:hypothetical protein [Escherichia coli]|uniref:hypothetical protein n=1 Tax=Escherichia coli TaxID=562 RepID=UPI002FCD39CB
MGTIVTANNIKVTVAGSGKKLRGLRHGPYRPDLVILDDIENDEMVRNPEQRDKLHDWLTKTVMPLGEAGGKNRYYLYRDHLHYDSVLSRTLNNPMWKTARFKAVIQWPANMKLWDEWEENSSQQTAGSGGGTLPAERSRHARRVSGVMGGASPAGADENPSVRDGHDTFDSEYQNDPVSGEDALLRAALSSGLTVLMNGCFMVLLTPVSGRKTKTATRRPFSWGAFNRLPAFWMWLKPISADACQINLSKT